MHHWPRLLGLGLIVLLLAGCGPSGPKTYEVSGTVTWNGTAVPDGVINFYPVDGATTPDSGKIKNGQYRFRAKAGLKRVEILANREVPGYIDPVMQSPVRQSYIPEPYNGDHSILQAEVKADGDNHFPFELPLKP